jgi:hypothetical protein
VGFAARCERTKMESALDQGLGYRGWTGGARVRGGISMWRIAGENSRSRFLIITLFSLIDDFRVGY